jgi:hypothetical protein
MAIECPTCQSENVQKMSMVYESGMSSIDANATTGGINGGGGGFGIGGARTKINGNQQTELSKKANPPVKKKTIRNAFLYFVGIFIIPALINNVLHINNQTIQVLVGICYLALGAYHVFTNIKYNMTIWPKLHETWDKEFMCLKCGVIFVPNMVRIPKEASFTAQ